MANRARVDAFIAHYASKYYDPVKAREYYLRNRELKGREPALSAESRQRQNEAKSYVTNEIKTRREADLNANAAVRERLSLESKTTSEAYKARMEKLQKDAEATRERITSKLEAYVEKVKNDLKIPPNASPKLRAFLESQRARRIGTAVNSASSELGKLREDLKSTITKARDEYREFRNQNSTARRANAEERRTITETYRNDLETERQNIRDQVR
jgi:hypothetical protein